MEITEVAHGRTGRSASDGPSCQHAVEGGLSNLECDDEKGQQDKKLANAMSKSQQLGLKCGSIHVENGDGDHVFSGLLQPASCGRTWGAVWDGKATIASGLDQLPKSVIAWLLGGDGFGHALLVTSAGV